MGLGSVARDPDLPQGCSALGSTALEGGWQRDHRFCRPQARSPKDGFVDPPSSSGGLLCTLAVGSGWGRSERDERNRLRWRTPALCGQDLQPAEQAWRALGRPEGHASHSPRALIEARRQARQPQALWSGMQGSPRQPKTRTL